MWIRGDKDGTVLVCRVHPNARKDAIEGVREDQLGIRLNAPPVEGKANKALQKFLSGILGIAKTKIEIRAGETGRIKVLALKGITPEEVREKLGVTERA
ncbi:MAG TPA: DUF167 domain-containing protein [Deltaproteobacteria bacterium]|jgi:hypothetical protein|nr:DUF167 domain-containing protein [Deltaproteobacteria bacterium]HOI06412.1 DUF167 domain-containing protein [Deltaproteobacteria bacterium]